MEQDITELTKQHTDLQRKFDTLNTLFLQHTHKGFDQSSILGKNRVALNDGATIDTNASLGSHFYVTLGGNRTLNAPSNLRDGQRIIFEIIQDGTGSRTLTLDSIFTFGVTLASITLTTTASKRDFIGCVYSADDAKLYVVAFSDGY